MKCELAQQRAVLAVYGELPDELDGALERHLASCEECSREWNALRALGEYLALHPVVEPSPNLLTQSRMRLDEALDSIPPHGLFTRLRSNFYSWLGHLQSAPALMTLLVGVGFLGGNFTYRYQVAHAPKVPGVVTTTNPIQGTVANITGILPTASSERVQVTYNNVIPASMEGSLDSPEIRQLLMMGMTQGASAEVRQRSVNLIANECKVGHACLEENAGKSGIRGALLVSLRYDKDPSVRLRALEGLDRYIGQDQRVRDAVLEALKFDENAQVRTAAIGLLTPVRSDASVRQVLRTVSTQDENPYIRTVSFHALEGSADIQ